MNQQSSSYIVIGKFGAVHGVHGWIKVFAYTENCEDILLYQPWYIQHRPQEWSEIQIEDSKPYQQYFLCKIKGFNTPEVARSLTNLTISIPRSQLPALKKDEYYWSDLIGLTVIHQDGRVLGKVDYLMATGSNDVLVIKNAKEHAIPFLLGTVIKQIDLDQKKIIVDWELI